MSTAILLALGLALVMLMAARLLLAGLPLRGRATALTVTEVAVRVASEMERHLA